MDISTKVNRILIIFCIFCVLVVLCSSCRMPLDTSTGINKRTEVSFQEEYYIHDENVEISCRVNLPDFFDPSFYYQTEIIGPLYPDGEASLCMFAEGKNLQNSYEVKERDGSVSYGYRYTDGSELSGVGGSLCYSSTRYPWVVRLQLNGLVNNSTFDLSFSDSDSCEKDIITTMKQLGIPEDEFRLQFVAVRKEELSDWSVLTHGDEVLTEKYKRYNYHELGDLYYFFSWQYAQGLPMIDDFSLTGTSAWGDSVWPFVAVISERGIEYFSCCRIYKWRETNQLCRFLSFEQIASVVVDKYNSILTDDQRTWLFTEASLLAYVWSTNDRDFNMTPVWIFQGKSSNGDGVTMLVNAVTGKEVFLY